MSRSLLIAVLVLAAFGAVSARPHHIHPFGVTPECNRLIHANLLRNSEFAITDPSDPDIPSAEWNRPAGDNYTNYKNEPANDKTFPTRRVLILSHLKNDPRKYPADLEQLTITQSLKHIKFTGQKYAFGVWYKTTQVDNKVPNRRLFQVAIDASTNIGPNPADVFSVCLWRKGIPEPVQANPNGWNFVTGLTTAWNPKNNDDEVQVELSLDLSDATGQVEFYFPFLVPADTPNAQDAKWLTTNCFTAPNAL